MRSKRKNKVSKGRLRKSKVRKTSSKVRKTSLRKSKRTQRRKSKKYSRKTRRSFIKKSRKNNRKLKGGGEWLQRELNKRPNASRELQKLYESRGELLGKLVGNWEATGTTVKAIQSKLTEKGKLLMNQLILEGYNLDEILQMTEEEQAKIGFGVMDRQHVLSNIPTETKVFTIWEDANEQDGLKGEGSSGEDSFTLENIELKNLRGRFSMEQVYLDGTRTKWSFKISADGNNLESGSWDAEKDSQWVNIGTFIAQKIETAISPASQLPQNTEPLTTQETVNPMG